MSGWPDGIKPLTRRVAEILPADDGYGYDMEYIVSATVEALRAGGFPGYHLVHEDDVPTGSPTSPPVTKRWSEADFALDAGWKACRDLIFGEDKP